MTQTYLSVLRQVVKLNIPDYVLGIHILCTYLSVCLLYLFTYMSARLYVYPPLSHTFCPFAYTATNQFHCPSIYWSNVSRFACVLYTFACVTHGTCRQYLHSDWLAMNAALFFPPPPSYYHSISTFFRDLSKFVIICK
jgi:hypothetical protein